MIKTPPSPTPAFIRINDRDLTEIELHSVESINDLHRTHPEHLIKDGRQPQCPGHSTNGTVQDMPVVCHTGFPRRACWQSGIFKYCTAAACRYSLCCVGLTLTLVILLLIFHFLVQQSSALQSLSQELKGRQDAALELTQVLEELRELRRNLTSTWTREVH